MAGVMAPKICHSNQKISCTAGEGENLEGIIFKKERHAIISADFYWSWKWDPSPKHSRLHEVLGLEKPEDIPLEIIQENK